MQDEGDRCGDRRDQRVAAPRQPDPELAVDHAVDVVDDRGQQVPPPTAESARGQRDEGVVHLHPAAGQEPERSVVRAQPLGVAKHRSGQAEGAHGHDRDEHGEHGGVGRGLDDQPAGGGGEGHAGRGGERREERAQAEVAGSAGPTGWSGTGAEGCCREYAGTVAGHVTRHGSRQVEPVVGCGDQRGSVGHDDHGSRDGRARPACR